MTKKKEPEAPAPEMVKVELEVPKNILDGDRQQLRAALGQLALEQLLAPENAETPS